MYGTSKKATEDVFSWLRSHTGVSTRLGFNAHFKLAVQAVKNGVTMPPKMIENLQTSIHLRQQLAEYHTTNGGLDESHMNALEVLGKFLHEFCPEQIPVFPESQQQEAYNSFDQPYCQQVIGFEGQQFPFPEFQYSPFYPQPPPFTPYYQTAYPDQMDFGYYQQSAAPVTYTEQPYESITADERLAPEDDLTGSLPLSTTTSRRSSTTYEQDFPALPKASPS